VQDDLGLVARDHVDERAEQADEPLASELVRFERDARAFRQRGRSRAARGSGR
jgi:hypothetical protein